MPPFCFFRTNSRLFDFFLVFIFMLSYLVTVMSPFDFFQSDNKESILFQYVKHFFQQEKNNARQENRKNNREKSR